MKLAAWRQFSFSPPIFAALALFAGCAAPKTVYVDDYRDLRPFTTTVLSNTPPAPASQSVADEQAERDKQVQASATGD